MGRASRFRPKQFVTLRFFIDYRRLNAMTIRDPYPKPLMDECLASFGPACVFSTLNCNSQYWQIDINKKHRHETWLVTNQELIKFKRMPFGLRNAPLIFQRAIYNIISTFQWKFCMLYSDVILIFSNNVEEHLKHITKVLTHVWKVCTALRSNKCIFMPKFIAFLWTIVQPDESIVGNEVLTQYNKRDHQKQSRNYDHYWAPTMYIEHWQRLRHHHHTVKKLFKIR